MKDLDMFVREQVVPFREKLMQVFAKEHPLVYNGLKAFAGSKKNRLGLQILEDNVVAGNYTFTLEGLDIINVENEILDPQLDLPIIGIIRPYCQLEKKELEKMLSDPALLGEKIMPAALKYLPELTIKFL